MASDESARHERSRTAREAIAADLGIPIEQIQPEARIVEDLWMDPFDLQELLEALEEEFGVASLEGEVQSIHTVADIECALVEARAAAA